jgi:hypothetical protein
VGIRFVLQETKISARLEVYDLSNFPPHPNRLGTERCMTICRLAVNGDLSKGTKGSLSSSRIGCIRNTPRLFSQGWTGLRRHMTVEGRKVLIDSVV